VRRLDTQTNLLKNPISRDTPANDLARRWRNRLYYAKNWVKLYLPTTLAVAYAAVFCALWLTSGAEGKWIETRLFERIGLVALFIFPLVIRFHLACLPALVTCGDAKSSIISHYRTSLFKGTDVALAMFFSAWNIGALPAASASTATYVLYLWMMNIYANPMELVVPAVAIFIGYFILELVLSGLGFLGAIIHRSKAAVIIAVAFPFLWIFSMLNLYPHATLIDHYTTYASVPLPVHIFTYFTAFENLVVFNGGGQIDPEAALKVDIPSLIQFFKLPLIWCVVIWAFIWSILGLSIGIPAKPDFPE